MLFVYLMSDIEQASVYAWRKGGEEGGREESRERAKEGKNKRESKREERERRVCHKTS